MHTHHKDIAILYHGGCPDGFGAAYASWKKFGNTAEYIPVKHGDPIPEKMNGREIFLVDFCYPKESMDELAKIVKSVTVLDHHEGIRDVASSFPGVFDTNRSGSTIAWEYFHPNMPTPRLLKYIEDDDLYRFALPETRDIFSYLEVYSYNFMRWDELMHVLESADAREALLVKASVYSEYFKLLGNNAVADAKLIVFEGYECYFANSHPSITMHSYVANQLVKKLPPIALVVSAHPEGFGVSIRGDGTVDVSKIAKKYGGGGHPNASGFSLINGAGLPWKLVEKEHENPGN